jgi:hypothetical protein
VGGEGKRGFGRREGRGGVNFRVPLIAVEF